MGEKITVSRASTLWTAARAIVYASVFVALWGWLAHEAHLRDVPFGFPLPGWVAPIGVALMAVGGVIAVACIATFVVRGKGNAESLLSASHGAGRRMSRNAAKKAFTLADHAQATSSRSCTR